MAFDHKHLIDITEYSADDIMTILETAKTFKQVNERRIKKVPTLKGFTVVNMFNEPSTRTRSSFEIAEKRLSADSLNFGGSSTATVKGESLVDTVKTLCSYKIDCIVVRERMMFIKSDSPYTMLLTPRMMNGTAAAVNGLNNTTIPAISTNTGITKKPPGTTVQLRAADKFTI